MKIQYLVNWSFTYQCRMSFLIHQSSFSSFLFCLTLLCSMPSYIQRGSATQNAPKLTIFR